MKRTLNFAGMLAVALGLVWVLQGVGILPGSFMSGQPKWAVIGTIMVAVGVVAILRARRRR